MPMLLRAPLHIAPNSCNSADTKAIELANVYKDYPSESTGRINHVLKGIGCFIRRGERVAILGRNGAGKSTLIRLISGVELPTAGAIRRTMSVSWPVGLSGGFAPSLTGNDNIRFVARIYGKPADVVRDQVEGFASLGRFLSEPVSSYSMGMRARLNFALSLAIDFDCYLIDEVISVGDQRFVRRSHEELFEKRTDRCLILASHSAEVVRSYCSRAIILHQGKAKLFDDLDLALAIYDDL